MLRMLCLSGPVSPELCTRAAYFLGISGSKKCVTAIILLSSFTPNLLLLIPS
ncbi:hypothetical protein CLAVI_000255 [Candidatus Clavichlamydia salmonicola]|nr:hypothetical protein [Candidatus Clavichlamydia salmonicola]